MFSRDFLKSPVTGLQFMKGLCINLSPPLFKIYKKKTESHNLSKSRERATSSLDITFMKGLCINLITSAF